MSSLGIDVARWQNPFALPYPAWLADGLEVVVIQITHGTQPEPVADEHLAVAVAAGVPHIVAYHWLTPESGRQQAITFKAELKPQHQFVAIDVEQAGVTAQHLLDFLAELGPGFKLTILLYGNNLLAAIVAAHPELKQYGVWYPGYPTFPLPCSDPPYLLPRNVPASIAGQVKAWQYAGNNGVWLPLKGAIDRSIWYEIPGVTMAPVYPSHEHGSQNGIHAQHPGISQSMFDRAKAGGYYIPWVFAVQNPGLCVNGKKADSRTVTGCRWLGTPENESMNGLLTWSDDKMWDVARQSIELAIQHTNTEEWNNIDFIQPGNNEVDPPGIEGWRKWGRMCDMLLTVADSQTPRLAAMGRKPMRLILLISNCGTPEWDELNAFLESDVDRHAQRSGAVWGFHEGGFVGQPVDWGFDGTPGPDGAPNHYTIPGAPYIPGSGTQTGRFKYWYSRLEARGTAIPFVVLETYLGGFYTLPVHDQMTRLGWYDRLVRQQRWLDPAQGRWRAACLGWALFTIGPEDGWLHADYSYVQDSNDFDAYMSTQFLIPNGGTDMDQAAKDHLVQLADTAAHSRNQSNADAAALDAAVRGIPVEGGAGQPLYMATVLQNVKIRDAHGNDLNQALTVGTALAVYKENYAVGPNSLGETYQNRAMVNVNGNNVAMSNNGQPTLKRI